MSLALGLKCVSCGADYPIGKMFEGCPKCRNEKLVSNLTVAYDYDTIENRITKETLSRRKPGVWRYSELLPVGEEPHRISLGEGATPLVKCDNLSKELGLQELYVKDESRNPTWSFKDRFCCVAIGVALDFGAKTVTVSSSGNHGASTAAYAAKSGIDCVIFTMGYAPKTFLTLMQAYGAEVVPVTTALGRWSLMERAVKEFGWYPINSYTLPMPTGNAYGTEGYKTMGYEIAEALNWDSPDRIVVPFGGGDGLFGIWKGFQELNILGFLDEAPSMVAAEPSAGGPLTNALKKGLSYVEKVEVKPTVAFSIGASVATYQALKTIRESNGLSALVSDDQIMKAQLKLAKLEGIYAEPSSAASIAAAERLLEQGAIDRDERIVCVVTSGGLKDPEATSKTLPQLPVIEPDWESFLRFLQRN